MHYLVMNHNVQVFECTSLVYVAMVNKVFITYFSAKILSLIDSSKTVLFTRRYVCIWGMFLLLSSLDLKPEFCAIPIL